MTESRIDRMDDYVTEWMKKRIDYWSLNEFKATHRFFQKNYELMNDYVNGRMSEMDE